VGGKRRDWLKEAAAVFVFGSVSLSSDSGEESLDSCFRQVIGVAMGKERSISCTFFRTVRVGEERELKARSELRVSRSDVLFPKSERSESISLSAGSEGVSLAAHGPRLWKRSDSAAWAAIWDGALLSARPMLGLSLSGRALENDGD